MAKGNAIEVTGTYGTMYYVKDMGKATAFFKKILGLKPTTESKAWTEFPVPGHALCLQSGSKDELPRTGILILKVPNVKAAAAALKANGLKVSEINEVQPGAFACDFGGPEGNVVALYQAPKA